MKKLTVKGLTVLALAFVLVVSSFGLSNQQASAATTQTSLGYWSHWAYPNPLLHGLTTTDGAGTVSVSLNQYTDRNGYMCNGCRFDWKMELQRQTDGYNTWSTIGTYTGYVVDYSQSHRTFYNIGTHNTFLRVKLTVNGVGTFYSKHWVR